MKRVTISQAKASLSSLVAAVEQGLEHEVIIMRRGQPAARLVPLDVSVKGQRIGVAKGKFEVTESSIEQDTRIAELFTK